eukprot:TRINITY_DN4948_c0_g2_i1.p1 TRINITY_DN4948_c0_g2~~TRINITY_DN4948_c0_g2_i1.p1  ORF type:complete len:556 (+),score=169.01 TRINITY_DN4948_c0_g2_i1:49-1716(+)
MALYVLFESASGYGLFERKGSDDIAQFHESIQEAVQDMGRFSRLMELKAFVPFSSAENALENINCISEGAIHETLREFLERNLPKAKSSKKADFTVGVNDQKLGQAVHETLHVPIASDEKIRECCRAIRVHFEQLIKSLKPGMLHHAQLGLAHSYSRSKVKFNVNRSDNMVIQAIALLDKMDKDINTFAMRVREWYSWHFPELVKLVNDNYMFARCVVAIQSKSTLATSDKLDTLTEIVGDEAVAAGIIDAARVSMGMELSQMDMNNVENFAKRVIGMAEYRKQLMAYLSSRMNSIAPNLTALMGEIVAARLIAHSGSLTSLAKYPASTIQILGAEKALFRALKARQNTPKYGLIFHSSFIGKASAANKGRISRYLANKASIASRIDCFSEAPTTIFGKKMHEQVEDRLKFYDTGAVPKKNVDVMHDAMQEAVKEAAADGFAVTATPSKKKRAAETPAKAEAPSAKKADKKAEAASAKKAEAPSAKKADKKEDKKEKKSKSAPAPMEVEEVKPAKSDKADKEAKKKAKAEKKAAKEAEKAEKKAKKEKKEKKSKK